MMKAIGKIEYRRVAPYTLRFTHKPYHMVPDLVCLPPIPEANWRKVYSVDVELHPVGDFCPGMDYSHMETADSITKTQPVTIALDITPVLITYLENLGDTDPAVIKDMREAIGCFSETPATDIETEE